MKFQCGVLYCDDRPATATDAARLIAGIPSESSEIAGTLANGSLLMVYRGTRITKEEKSEAQPTRMGPYSLTWDGRLDNRGDLARRLGLANFQNVPDPVLVLQAYTSFGDRVFEDMVGEFALVLWCKRTQRLQFARSACGARTLYYALNENTLTWSSNFAHLVRATNVDLAVNDDYVIEYLISQPPASVSPLANIGVIPTNRLVEFSNGNFRNSRELWNPTRFATVRHRSDAEYEEHLREVVEEAVTARLRSDRVVFAELSGGLDSSTIVLMADEVLQKQNRPAMDLQTTSCVYERSETCDETRFIRAVEERRGISTHIIHEADQRINLGLSNAEFSGLPNALHCFPGRYPSVASQMSAYGASVLLSGRGGDHLFWSEPDGSPLVADEISRGHFFNAHSVCATWSQAAGAPYYELLLKRALPLTFESRSSRKIKYKVPAMRAWLHPKLCAKITAIAPSCDGFATWAAAPSKRAQMVMMEHMFRCLGSGFLHEYSDIYPSHPYSYRPLIEFCLGTPVSQFLRNGETRSLMRRAFRDLLPAKTAKRVSKGLLDETITRALQAEWASISDVSKWQICEREYAVGGLLADALNRARLGNLDVTGNVIRICSLERWLRSLSTARCNKTPVLDQGSLVAG